MPWPNSKQFQAIPSTAKHLEAPYDDVYMTCYVMTDMNAWPLTNMTRQAGQTNQFVQSRADQTDLICDLAWLVMAWHGLAQTDTSAVWSCLTPFVHLILQVLCFQWRSCLSYFQTLCSWFYCEFGITLAYHTMRPFSVACFYICYQIKGRFSHFVFITKTGKV